MKQTTKLLLLFGFVIFLLGCIKSPSEKISFEQGYSEIINAESTHNLSKLDEIEAYSLYLENFKSSLEDDKSKDALSLSKFIEFRINLLAAQKNILLSEEILNKGINCSEKEKAQELIGYLEIADKSFYNALASLDELKTKFPEYLEKTSINDTTSSALETAANATSTMLKSLKQELEKCG